MSYTAHKPSTNKATRVKAFKILRHTAVSARPHRAHLQSSDQHKVQFRRLKDDTVRFRVHSDQKKYWLDALSKLGVEDLSTYARAAVERAITQDLRSLDPKWQDFVKAIQPIAEDRLGVKVEDSSKDRNENLKEIYEVLDKHRPKK